MSSCRHLIGWVGIECYSFSPAGLLSFWWLGIFPKLQTPSVIPGVSSWELITARSSAPKFCHIFVLFMTCLAIERHNFFVPCQNLSQLLCTVLYCSVCFVWMLCVWSSPLSLRGRLVSCLVAFLWLAADVALCGHTAVCQTVMAVLWFILLILLRIRVWEGSSWCHRGPWM